VERRVSGRERERNKECSSALLEDSLGVQKRDRIKHGYSFTSDSITTVLTGLPSEWDAYTVYRSAKPKLRVVPFPLVAAALSLAMPVFSTIHCLDLLLF
jgi:hypothetical protein